MADRSSRKGRSRKVVSFDEVNIASTSAQNDADDVLVGASARKRNKQDAAASDRDDADLQNSSESDENESDSGEEDVDLDGEVNKTEKLKKRSTDVEGEENDTLVSYDGVRITPFNMRDELDEGEIDSSGNFVYNRDKLRKLRATTDNWLESLDYMTLPDAPADRSKSKAKAKVKAKGTFSDADEQQEAPKVDAEANQENEGGGDADEDDDDEDEESEPPLDQSALMLELSQLFAPGDENETVLSAIKRCGRVTQRYGKKKGEQMADDTVESNRKQLLRLTELADALMSRFGITNAYELTYRDVQSWLASHASKAETARSEANADVDADMFSDAFELPPKSLSGLAENKTSEAETKLGTPKWELPEVAWELKWSAASESTIYGLFSSAKMEEWLAAGYFDTRSDCDALVRKVDTKLIQNAFEQRFGSASTPGAQSASSGTSTQIANGVELTDERLMALASGTAQLEIGIGNGPFYNVKRIDFSLYTE